MSENPAIKQFQLAGVVYDLQVDSVNNCNPTAVNQSKFDWIGTQAEYVAQDVATNHPDWVCFITDDISDQTGIIDLSNYVKKTGDEEIGGTKTFTSSTIYLKSETPYNQTPATTQHTKLYITDGTTVFGAVESAQRPDGANGMQINAKGQIVQLVLLLIPVETHLLMPQHHLQYQIIIQLLQQHILQQFFQLYTQLEVYILALSPHVH